MGFIFASESVTEGHPDKVCDQISDAILDAILKEDPESRVAIEVMAANGVIIVAGEVTTNAYVDIASIAKAKLVEIGYDSSKKSLDGNTCGVLVNVGSQSPEIASGVNNSYEEREEGINAESIGAGDQGLMFGYACDENKYYMPTAIHLAHELTRELAAIRKEGNATFIYPDGKSQVVIEYDDNNEPKSVLHVLISTQHSELTSLASIRKFVEREVILPVIEKYNQELIEFGKTPLDTSKMQILVNPAGEWNMGGPAADAGLTGRKIIVDTYGGFARHGGGNFQGKDPSKVDRSAAYALRQIAKSVVASGLAKRCELQICYAIGKAYPIGLYLDTFGTNTVPNQEIIEKIKHNFDMTPSGIIDSLGLKQITNYQEVARYGHFGKNAELAGMPWEKTKKL